MSGMDASFGGTLRTTGTSMIGPNETFESAEVAERLLELEAESPLLGVLNRRIVQVGGSPIPARRPQTRPRWLT